MQLFDPGWTSRAYGLNLITVRVCRILVTLYCGRRQYVVANASIYEIALFLFFLNLQFDECTM